MEEHLGETTADGPVSATAGVGGVALYAAIIALAALAAWSNSFYASFHFDDFSSITLNESIKNLKDIGAVLYTQPLTSLIGRPLPNLLIAINYAIGGESVLGYHIVNIALHICAALALFGLLRRTFLLPRLREVFGPRATALAFICALVWALHPLQTAAVTYIIQRIEVMASLFYLLTLYSFARSAEGGEREGVWRGLAVVSCAAAFASKEITASLPLAVLLYDRAFVSGKFASAWRRRKSLYLMLASCWLLMIALNVRAGSRSGSVIAATGYTPLEYLQLQFVAVTRYLKLAFWPHPLIFDYGSPPVGGLGEIAAPCALILLLFAATAFGVRKNHPLGFCGAVFFMVLAPTSSILPIVDPIFEHRMYLPLSAVVVAVLAGGAYLLFARGAGGARAGRLAGVITLVVAVALGSVTYARNRAYENEYTLWYDTWQKVPGNARALQNIASHHYMEKRYAEAEPYFLRALELNPNIFKARLYLGILQNELGKKAESAKNLAGAVALQPADPLANYHYGLSLLSAGRKAEGLEQLKRIEAAPDITAEKSLFVAGKLASEGYAAEALAYALYARERALAGGDAARAAALYSFIRDLPAGGAAR